jgi:hypothetical protein
MSQFSIKKNIKELSSKQANFHDEFDFLEAISKKNFLAKNVSLKSF